MEAVEGTMTLTLTISTPLAWGVLTLFAIPFLVGVGILVMYAWTAVHEALERRLHRRSWRDDDPH